MNGLDVKDKIALLTRWDRDHYQKALELLSEAVAEHFNVENLTKTEELIEMFKPVNPAKTDSGCCKSCKDDTYRFCPWCGKKIIWEKQS